MRKALWLLRQFPGITSLLASPAISPTFSTMALSRHLQGGRMVHLNHAGASPSSTAVVQRVKRHLDEEVSLGGYAAKDAVNQELALVYKRAATLIHASSPLEIALTESATAAWTRLFYAFASHQERYKPTKEKIILISQAEYAANVVAACQWARTHKGWSVRMIPSTTTPLPAEGGTTPCSSTGTVDVDALASMLAGTYKDSNGKHIDPQSIALVCTTHIPTNSGIVNPVNDIGQCIADYNKDAAAPHSILYLADTCQSVGQVPIDVTQMHCSGLVATGRKYLRGPRGTGFLYIPQAVLEVIMPHHLDHYGVPVDDVPLGTDVHKPLENVIQFTPRPGATRFEFWESNIAGRLGVGQALYEHLEQGQSTITESILQRANILQTQLGQIRKVKLYHNSKCGVVTFWIPGIDSFIIAAQLQEYVDGVAFEVSVVPATSTPLDSAVTRVPDLLRASVSYTTTTQDIGQFVKRLDKILNTI